MGTTTTGSIDYDLQLLKEMRKLYEILRLITLIGYLVGLLLWHIISEGVTWLFNRSKHEKLKERHAMYWRDLGL